MNPWIIVLGVLFLAVLALIGGVWIVGSALPVGHIASSSACLRRTREEVWAVLVDVERQVEWRPGLQAVKRTSESGDSEAWRETTSFGVVDAHVAKKVEGERLVVEMNPEERAFSGSWTFALSPCVVDGVDGTRLTVTENGEIYNPFFRFMSRYLTGYHKTQQDYLRALGRYLGETDVTVRTDV